MTSEVENPTISSEALAALQSDSWPGNVRELENVTRRLLLSATWAFHKRQCRSPASWPPAMPKASAIRLLLYRVRRRFAAAGAPRRASCRTLIPASSPKPSAEILTQAHHPGWKATRRKLRAGLGCPASPCGKNSSTWGCTQTPPRSRPTRNRTPECGSRVGPRSPWWQVIAPCERAHPVKPDLQFTFRPLGVNPGRAFQTSRSRP